MTEEHFQKIYRLLNVRKKVHAVAQGDLDSFEDIAKVALPASYQQYCRTFGLVN